MLSSAVRQPAILSRRRSFMAQPFRHPRSGVFYIRRKVPPELQAVLGREYKKTLKTREPSEAKLRFAVAWADAERAFQQARAGVQRAQSLGHRDAQLLAQQWAQTVSAEMDRTGHYPEWLLEEGSMTAEDGTDVPWLVSLRVVEPEEWPDGVNALIEQAIARTLKAQGIPMPPDQATWAVLHDAFRDGVLKVSDLAAARQGGNWGASVTGATAGMPVQVTPVVAAQDGRGLLPLFESYSEAKQLDDGKGRAVQKTLKSTRAVLELFIDLEGDVPVSQITREMVQSFRGYLARLPSRGEGARKLSAMQLIAKADAEGLPRAQPATIRNKLRALSAVLSHGVRMNWIPENPVIASGVGKAAAKAATKRASKRRKDYSPQELARIFTCQIYADERGWAGLSPDYEEAWYWMPLLMYYTGARREEVAQLMADEVRTEGGIAYLSILEALDDDDDLGRGVKNTGSRRRIPLHPDLLARGFLTYVASVPRGGQLFPKLKPNPAGYYGANFGKHWGKYLRNELELGATASPSHGFRHTFKTLCRQVGIPEDVHDAITGHTGAGAVARGYGQMPLSRMAEELSKFPTVGQVLE